MRDIAILKSACDAVIADPKLQPIKDPVTGKIVQTFCNFAAMRIAHAMNCDELRGLIADGQYHVMDQNDSGRWFKVAGGAATAYAMIGGLVFAAMTNKMLGEGHGHIAAVYPLPMQLSGSLSKDVPMVANIGATIGVMRSSQAFPVAYGEPDYFCWTG